MRSVSMYSRRLMVALVLVLSFAVTQSAFATPNDRPAHSKAPIIKRLIAWVYDVLSVPIP